jgi:hypothetical protein
MTVTKLNVTTAVGALSGTATAALNAGSAAYASLAGTAAFALDAQNANHADSADTAVDDSKVAKIGDTMSGSLNITKAGEVGVEVNNTA